MSVTLAGVGVGIAATLAAEAVIGGVTYYFHPEYFSKCQGSTSNASIIVPQEKRDFSNGGLAITYDEGFSVNLNTSSIEPIVNL